MTDHESNSDGEAPEDLAAIEAELDEEIGFEPAGEEPAPGYEADPDDDPQTRNQVAAEDAAALTRAALVVSIATVLLAGVLSLLGVPGMQTFAKGLAVGSGVATLNLRILANASWWIFSGRIVASLLAFGASFASLILVAVWLVKVHPSWTLGYGVGLGLPGLAGILYAYTAAKRAQRESSI